MCHVVVAAWLGHCLVLYARVLCFYHADRRIRWKFMTHKIQPTPAKMTTMNKIRKKMPQPERPESLSAISCAVGAYQCAELSGVGDDLRDVSSTTDS